MRTCDGTNSVVCLDLPFGRRLDIGFGCGRVTCLLAATAAGASLICWQGGGGRGLCPAGPEDTFRPFFAWLGPVFFATLDKVSFGLEKSGLLNFRLHASPRWFGGSGLWGHGVVRSGF